MASIPAVVKWGKERLSVTLRPGQSSDELFAELFELTRVPIERQKITCAGAWKGALKDGITLDSLALKPGQTSLTLMLMGTADAAPTGPSEPIRFAEDMSMEEVAAAAAEITAEATSKAEGFIAALQYEPGPERDSAQVNLMSNLPIKYN